LASRGKGKARVLGNLFPKRMLNDDGEIVTDRRIVSGTNSSTSDSIGDATGLISSILVRRPNRTAPSGDERDEDYYDATEAIHSDDGDQAQQQLEQELRLEVEQNTKAPRVSKLSAIHAACANCKSNDAIELVRYLNTKGRGICNQTTLDKSLRSFIALYEKYQATPGWHKLKGWASLPVCKRHFKDVLKSGGIKTNFPIPKGIIQLRHV
jgi:hypothetical protein